MGTMNFEVINPQGGYAVLKATMNEGDEFISMPGTVTSLKGANFSAQKQGGLLGGLKRSITTGTNVFMDRIFFESNPGEAIVAPRFPGQIGEISLVQEIFAHSHSFLATNSGVEVGSRSLGVRSLFASGNLFWISLKGDNSKKAWLSFFGDIMKVDLKAGEKISVEHGHFVALTAQSKFQIRFLGMKRALMGGEGLYMVDIEGPGSLWVQTRNLDAFIMYIAEHMPKN